MARLSLYALFFVLTLAAPDFEKQQFASDHIPSSPRVEEDEAFLLALKYRQEILQVIETDLFHFCSILPKGSPEENLAHLFCEVNPQASTVSDSCYAFMS